ncbi:MAG: biopolymer transporter ExbD [Proteobacteria bacterium]|nr:biopolymer transporter ExbD [Pseudomonadota bacterium]MBU1687705.1 biopolymer transporter ExbD [Pseudomonadota bacterium]
MKVTMPVRARARIEMIPLIDIVFLLLVFFIYAMLSMAVHHGLPVELPSSATAQTTREMILSVTIQADSLGESRILVDDHEVSLADLTTELSIGIAALGENGGMEPGVLLFADKGIDYQTLFAVLDGIHQAGLTRISLQADVDRE